MVEFDERRPHQYSRRPAEEDAKWRWRNVKAIGAGRPSDRFYHSSCGQQRGSQSQTFQNYQNSEPHPNQYYHYHHYPHPHHHNHRKSVIATYSNAIMQQLPSQPRHHPQPVPTSQQQIYQLMEPSKISVESASNHCKSKYWLHPNMAITRESDGVEEFFGECIPFQPLKSNIIVNYFTGLENMKLRFSHTAHTPPVYKPPVKRANDYLQKNLEDVAQKLDALLLSQKKKKQKQKDGTDETELLELKSEEVKV